jgi:hypothetical protein
MSKTLNEIVKTMQQSYGTEGAIERIMANDWPVETKRLAIEMIEGPCRDDALVEGGEINGDEFFQ